MNCLFLSIFTFISQNHKKSRFIRSFTLSLTTIFYFTTSLSQKDFFVSSSHHCNISSNSWTIETPPCLRIQDHLILIECGRSS